MDKNFLKNESNALLAQKHQVQIAEAKLAEINNALDLLHGQQSSHKEMLDKLMLDIDTLLEEVGYDENCALSVIDSDGPG